MPTEMVSWHACRVSLYDDAWDVTPEFLEISTQLGTMAERCFIGSCQTLGSWSINVPILYILQRLKCFHWVFFSRENTWTKFEDSWNPKVTYGLSKDDHFHLLRPNVLKDVCTEYCNRLRHQGELSELKIQWKRNQVKTAAADVPLTFQSSGRQCGKAPVNRSLKIQLFDK